jgi:hypothetical protein
MTMQLLQQKCAVRYYSSEDHYKSPIYKCNVDNLSSIIDSFISAMLTTLYYLLLHEHLTNVVIVQQSRCLQLF